MPDNVIQKIFQVLLQYKVDDSAKKAGESAEDIKKRTEEAAKAADQMRLHFRRMREESEKLRGLGLLITGIGAALSGPILLAMNTYLQKQGAASKESLQWQANLKRTEDATARIGKIAAETVLPVMTQISKVTSTIADFVEKHPEVVKIALTGGSILTAAGMVLTIAGQVRVMIATLGRLGILTQTAGGGIGIGGAGRTGLGIAAGIAGVAAGAGIYDATIGKTQGLTAGGILGMAASNFSYNVTKLTQGETAASKAFQDTAEMYGLVKSKAEETNEQLQITAEQISKMTEAEKVYTIALIQQAAEKAKQVGGQLGGIGGGILQALGIVTGQGATSALSQSPLVKSFADYQQTLLQKEDAYNKRRVQIMSETLNQLGLVERKFKQDVSVIDNRYNNERVKALLQADQAMANLDKTYYKQRAEALSQSNEQTRQNEAQHAKDMQRMQQDHSIRLRKLAEERDYLGILDENESYNIQRDRAEEDYQVQVKQQNAQAAKLLAAMDENYRQQRDEQKKSLQVQLSDLQQSHDQEKALRTKQYIDEAKAATKDGQDKLDQLRNQYESELTQINSSWRDRRRDLGLWLVGEREQFSQYMSERQKDMQKWIDTHFTFGANTTTTTPPVVHAQAVGGYTTQPTLALRGEQGREFTLDNRATEQAERMLGRKLTQEGLLGSLGGMSLNATLNIGPVSAAGSPEELGAAIEEHVYSALVSVMQQARIRSS